MNPILATILIANMLFMIYDMIRKRQSNRYAWFVIVVSLAYFVFHNAVFLIFVVVYSLFFYSKQNGDMKKEINR
ncbi:MAG: hypothetical protein SPD91_00040 [Streptococcus hyointestinalis]|uniref:hypothetical protein n=1 Tax=Streptococcus hyointestinalis TaxID=1337 RepID=UPI0023F453BF|nr:hypothetical protein [Streptococcus hyointestinalis]MDD7355547.1 hypothetical protein [Streptococcus hyointestinalis]MDY4552854.1 hypothetical protein [Streptococcus hyointestinalis]